MNTYTETQKALRIWLLAIAALVWCGFIVFTVFAVKQQLINGVPFGDKPMSDNMLVFFLIMMNAVFMFLEALVVILKLEVTIDKFGITYSYFPFVGKRTIKKEDIKFAFVRKYKPIKEYGGWGYRKLFRNKAYNVWGKWGIQIVMNDGKALLLGTQKQDEARAALESFGYKIYAENN